MTRVAGTAIFDWDTEVSYSTSKNLVIGTAHALLDESTLLRKWRFWIKTPVITLQCYFFVPKGLAYISSHYPPDIYLHLIKTFFLVSAYELHSSGLIQALLKMFAVESKNRKSSKLQRQRVEIFRKVFCTKPGEDIATGIKI